MRSASTKCGWPPPWRRPRPIGSWPTPPGAVPSTNWVNCCEHASDRRRRTTRRLTRPGHCGSTIRAAPCRSILPQRTTRPTKACIQAQAKAIQSDGEIGWGQRCCDAFLGLIRSVGGVGGSARARAATPPAQGVEGGKDEVRERSNQAGGEVQPPFSPYFAVLHAPLQALVDPEGTPTDLAGDLEQGGLLSLETVRRLLCDCTFVVAVDDDSGHTMYEGRKRGWPTGSQRREIWRRDRCCRFPGCQNKTFTQPHHLDWWIKRGTTDLPNLALLCSYHHHLVHRKGWTVRGNVKTPS